MAFLIYFLRSMTFYWNNSNCFWWHWMIKMPTIIIIYVQTYFRIIIKCYNFMNKDLHAKINGKLILMANGWIKSWTLLFFFFLGNIYLIFDVKVEFILFDLCNWFSFQVKLNFYFFFTFEIIIIINFVNCAIIFKKKFSRIWIRSAAFVFQNCFHTDTFNCSFIRINKF